MKVLFTLHSTAHYAYHESTIRALLGRGHEVRVRFAKEGSVSPLARVLDRRPADGGERFAVGWLTPRADRWRRVLVPARALRSYSSYLRQPEQSDYYRARWQKRLGTWLEARVERPVVRRLLASTPAFRALGVIERVAPPAKPVLAELSADRPDVIVASPANLRDPEEIEYVKAARRLGIPSVLPVLSWDNLTTKGLIHVAPDLLLAWNETHRGEAVRVHGIPAGRVAVTGSPFFDAWFEDVAVEQREVFCRRVGLDPDRPYAVYLGSSKNIARDETWLVRELLAELRGSGDPGLVGLQLLVRPHPANAAVYAALDEPGVAIWPKAGQLPDSDAARDEFRATLEHAIAAVGINTSGMIDAVIADRPCVALVVAEYDATQRDAVHFTHLVGAQTVEVADGPAPCAEVLGRLLRGADATRDARRQFVEAFVRPRGRGTPAGALMAQAIEQAADGRSGNEIDAALAAA